MPTYLCLLAGVAALFSAASAQAAEIAIDVELRVDGEQVSTSTLYATYGSTATVEHADALRLAIVPTKRGKHRVRLRVSVTEWRSGEWQSAGEQRAETDFGSTATLRHRLPGGAKYRLKMTPTEVRGPFDPAARTLP